MDKTMLAEFVEAVEKDESTAGSRIRKAFSKLKDIGKTFFDSLSEHDDDRTSGHSGQGQGRPRQYAGHSSGGHYKSHENRAGPKHHQTFASGLVLYIYAMEQRSIDRVMEDIKNMNTEKLLNDQKIQTFVEKLTSDQERKLRELEKEHQIKIDVSKNPLNKSILLKGDPVGIAEAVHAIFEMVLITQSKESELRELEILGKGARWEYNDGTKWHAFDDVTRGRIERASLGNKPTVEWKYRGKTYRITFKDSIEEIVEEPGKKFQIRKFTSGRNIELPKRWAPMPPDKLFLAVPLNTTDEEYKKVITHLAQPALAIQKIERIQNPMLYRQYMSYKKDMDSRNAPAGGAPSAGAGAAASNETRLWHGTAGVNVVNINSRNFNRSYCGQHGVAIGNGVYFATGSSYSIRGYCPADAGTGLKYIYQARVLTGKTVAGAGGMKEPPNLPGRTDATYDSVCDNPAGPSMYVVFKDPQTYPEYLITFK